MKELSLEFGTNMFGKLQPEIKKRLQDVINNPCQETWDDAHSIILNAEGGMTTLWNAVIEIDWDMQQSKPLGAEWLHIPSKEIIIKAIKLAVFKQSKLDLN